MFTIFVMYLVLASGTNNLTLQMLILNFILDQSYSSVFQRSLYIFSESLP